MIQFLGTSAGLWLAFVFTDFLTCPFTSPQLAPIKGMRYFFTLLLLAGSSLCFGQIARDSEPEAPSLVSAATAQSYFAQLYANPEEANVYICNSKTVKAYHRWRNCRGLDKCNHDVEKVTETEAKEDYGRTRCMVCY